MNIITRKEAKVLKLTRFFTGVTCDYGHLSERETASGRCVKCKRLYRASEAAKTLQKLQQRKWSDDNRGTKNLISRESHKRCHPRGRKFCTISSFIRGSLARILTDYKGTRGKGEALCGYTLLELKLHIESLWEQGMSWDNRSEWHIDHIKSVKSFKDEGILCPKVINALSNLQPLWKSDNLKKGYK